MVDKNNAINSTVITIIGPKVLDSDRRSIFKLPLRCSPWGGSKCLNHEHLTDASSILQVVLSNKREASWALLRSIPAACRQNRVPCN